MNITDSNIQTPRFTFKLINPVTDNVVAGYEDLSAISEIDLGALGLESFNVVAQVESDDDSEIGVESIKFESNMGDRIENTAPYAIFGDIGGDFLGKNVSSGLYELKATAFSGDGGTGELVASANLGLKIVNAQTSPPNPTPNPPSNPVPPSSGSLIDDYDQVLLFLDGNNNDYDDIAALPIAALYAKAAGLEDKFAIFYNNNLGELNRSYQLEAMRESAAFAEKIGIKTYDYQANIDGTTRQLANILNSGEKVLTLQGGPMEAIYRGLEQTRPESRSNVTLLTHGKGNFNQNRDKVTVPGITEVRTWKDIIEDFPEVPRILIENQNGDGDGTGNDGFRSQDWNWLDSSQEPLLQEARQLMQNAEEKVNDTSDAGMLFYAITGNEEGDPNDSKVFFDRYFAGENPSPVIAPPPEGNGTGLTGIYYDDLDFKDPVVFRQDETVNFDWAQGSPDPLLGSDTFSVRWSGSVLPQYTETYDFSTIADDGVRLWINDQLIIDDFTTHAPKKNTGSIDLEAGQLYKIRMDYFEKSGGAVSKLLWSSNSQTEEIIPESQLYSLGPGDISP